MEHLTLKAVTTPTTDQGVFEAVISTESVDREKDVVVASALVAALKKWNRPLPLSWEHSSQAEDIFGSIEPMTAREENGEVVAQGQVDLESKVGQEAWRSFKSRAIGFSFGYLIPDGGFTKRKGGGRNITELDIYEVTATLTPMNNDTRVLSTKGKTPEEDENPEETPDEKALWTAAFDDGLPENLSDDVKGRLAQKAREVFGIDDARDDEPREAKSEAQDPLNKGHARLQFEFATEGIDMTEPPQVKEEPPPELPSRDQLERQFYDLMLETIP